MHPTREWFIGLAAAVIIMVLIAAWSAQTYLQYDQLSVAEMEPGDATQTVYREALVAAAIDTYTARETQFNELLYGPAAPVDTDPAPVATTTEVIEPPPTPPTSTPATTTPVEESPAPPATPTESDVAPDEEPTTPTRPESPATTSTPAAGLPGTF